MSNNINHVVYNSLFPRPGLGGQTLAHCKRQATFFIAYSNYLILFLIISLVCVMFNEEESLASASFSTREFGAQRDHVIMELFWSVSAVPTLKPGWKLP